MNEREIYENLKPIIIDVLNVKDSEISPEKTFKDLGADSLDAVELIMEVETEFDIAISDNDMEKLHTVQDIVTFVETHSK